MKRTITKRAIILIAIMAMIMSCVGSAAAANVVNQPQASDTLASYNVVLRAGTEKGELKLNFNVKSTDDADLLGVSLIKIYKSDGQRIGTTIYGTLENDLVCEDDSYHTSTYPIYLTSGTYYYMEVTVFASIGHKYDSRTITTATVKAP